MRALIADRVTCRALGLPALLVGAALLVLAVLCLPAPAHAAAAEEQFGVKSFTTSVTNQAGETYTQAGGHPYQASTTIETNVKHLAGGATGSIDGGAKDLLVDLPAGFIGNPQAVPRCPIYQLASCPPDTQVGTFTIVESVTNGTRVVHAVYNMVPEKGYPAEFGFYSSGKTSDAQFLFPSVRAGSGYQLRISSVDIPQITLESLSLTFWGVPAEAGHDRQRGQFCRYLGPAESESEACEGGGQTDEEAEKPFLTNPVDCAAGPPITTLSVDDWYEPGVYQTYRAVSPALSGCEDLAFGPSLSIQPSLASEGGTVQADEPSAYTVDLRVPQNEDASELATPELRDATVTLPEGVSVSPAAADGLAGCQETGPEGINLSEEQLNVTGVIEPVAGHCPAASTLGTMEVFTPLLADGPNESAPLQGHIYLAEPRCGESGQPACTTASASNGELYGIYLEAQGDGVIVKLKGSVSANPANGQLTATFDENPPLPFSDLRLHFNGGPRAPLANPAWCGQATTTSILSAWSEGVGGTPAATPSSVFDVAFGAGGGACPASVPFAPSFSAGSTSVAAGAFSPFSVTFTRSDRQQTLYQVAVSTPEGLLGKIAGVPRCGEAQANAGNCSAASQIGTTTVAAGAGSAPFYLSGQVYLTGPYRGAPFGLSIVVPANAGPFHLGNVVVRAAIDVNPTTAALTITSNPLPQIIDGVPLRLQSVNVTVNRPEFMLNPTDCTPSSVDATISGDQGAQASVSSSFDVGGCQGLKFVPTLSAATQGKASALKEGEGASFDVKIAQQAGEANIKRVDVTLPTQLPARLQPTLQNACTEAQFAANPAGCPEDSFVGTATATTPILGVPLTGPAIFVSHGGEAFPDLDLILQGEGVTIVLTGHTLIQGKTTYSRFETVPDAPISSFELKLPEGPHSALASSLPTADHSLCGQKLEMPTAIEGQNGALVTQTTKIAIEGCGPILTLVSHKVSGQTATILVKVPSAGKVTATGKGLVKASKSPGKAKTVTLKLKRNKDGSAKVKVKVAFKPSKTGAKSLVKYVTVTFKAKHQKGRAATNGRDR